MAVEDEDAEVHARPGMPPARRRRRRTSSPPGRRPGCAGRRRTPSRRPGAGASPACPSGRPAARCRPRGAGRTAREPARRSPAACRDPREGSDDTCDREHPVRRWPRNVTQSYIMDMLLLKNLRPGGRYGIAGDETRDPIGYAVAAMNRLARSDLLDRLRLRKQAEQAVFTVTRGGFRTATTAGRAFARAGKRGRAGARAAHTAPQRRLRPDADRGRADARRRRHRARVRGAPAGRRRRRRRLRRAGRGADRGQRDRAAPPGRARVARRHLGGAGGDGRHAGRGGAGAGRPRPGRRRRWHPVPSRPRSPPGAPTSSSRPTSRRSPGTTSPLPRWR